MKKMLASILILMSLPLPAQKRAFPTREGFEAMYEVFDAKNQKMASYTLILRNISGNEENGSLDMVYLPCDEAGKLLFSKPSEYVMGIVRTDGQTLACMPDLGRLLKMQKLLPAGDAGSVPRHMAVGESLPVSTMDVQAGKVKCLITVSDKKVLEHGRVTVPAGTFDCFLVYEKTANKNPIATDVCTSKTWYCVGVGIVKQVVYDSKGRVRSSQRLVSLK